MPVENSGIADVQVDREPRRERLLAVRQVFAWSMTALVLVATLMPVSWLQAIRGSKAGESQLPRLLFGIIPFDKFAHFTLFAGLAAGWTWALPFRRSLARNVLAIVVVLAVVTEVLQSIPAIGRDAGLDDGLADLLGGIVALAIAGAIRVFVGNRGSSQSA